MTPDSFDEIRKILNHYDLGDLVDYEPDERGTVNTSFAIQTSSQKRYFLRRYKAWIKEEELIFEHAVINRLKDRGLDMVAGVLKTRDGSTYVRGTTGYATYYYAIFEFLPGEDKYTWVDPILEPDEVISSARTLARFHQAMIDFQPPGKRYEPKILDLLPALTNTISAVLDQGKETVFDLFLKANQARLNRVIAETWQALSQPYYASLPQLIIHCDYHPGNLKFKNGEVVGLFDFDWCKLDARCFDIGLALLYFFCSWRPENDGALRLDDLSLFLSAYQSAWRGNTAMGPLSQSEQQALPWMIQASNLYVLNWGFLDYINKPVDPQEYLRYLQHGIGYITWTEQGTNQRKLEEAIAAACH